MKKYPVLTTIFCILIGVGITNSVSVKGEWMFLTLIFIVGAIFTEVAS